MSNAREVPTEELIASLRRAAAIWFKNSDLLLMEELIRRLLHATRKEGDAR